MDQYEFLPYLLAKNPIAWCCMWYIIFFMRIKFTVYWYVSRLLNSLSSGFTLNFSTCKTSLFYNIGHITYLYVYLYWLLFIMYISMVHELHWFMVWVMRLLYRRSKIINLEVYDLMFVVSNRHGHSICLDSKTSIMMIYSWSCKVVTSIWYIGVDTRHWSDHITCHSFKTLSKWMMWNSKTSYDIYSKSWEDLFM